MPRYFFDVMCKADTVQHDISGADLPDADCAMIEGFELAKQVSGGRVQVLNDLGEMLALLVAPCSDAGSIGDHPVS
jgi:hypothetical protein